jgi:hypothetical protein
MSKAIAAAKPATNRTRPDVLLDAIQVRQTVVGFRPCTMRHDKRSALRLARSEPVGSAAPDALLTGPPPTHGHWLGGSRPVANRRNIRLAVGRGVRVRIAVRRFAWIRIGLW